MYNPLLSYEENLNKGPSPEWNSGGSFPRLTFTGEPRFACLGVPLQLPLGIPAGPLLSAAYVRVALAAGFSMPVYKTVRATAWPSHPWPNVLSVQTLSSSQNAMRPEACVVPMGITFVQDAESRSRLSITNAFGVPSQSPELWKQDFQSLPQQTELKGQWAVLSFQGSRRAGETWKDFLADTENCADIAGLTVTRQGGLLLEMNVSCPNEAGAPVYTDLAALEETLRAARAGLRNHPHVKLIIKLGFLEQKAVMKTVELVSRFADGISAVNTLSANIVDPVGRRALGSGAEHGGICGQAIHLPALQMVSEFHKARRALSLDNRNFALIGVGGCSNFESLMRFMEAGADVVHAATGAMWHLQLAGECARGLGIPYLNEDIHS